MILHAVDLIVQSNEYSEGLPRNVRGAWGDCRSRDSQISLHFARLVYVELFKLFP